ncbi:MAG: ribonuclease R [Planctomycetota bacterium]|nr:ribonuclease R [Planctomycetota bacterium]
MGLRFKRRLLHHLRHEDYTPKRVSDLAEELGIAEAEREEFRKAIEQFEAEGLLHLSSAGHVQLPSLADMDGEIEGVFRKAMKGFGFVEPEPPVREGTVFIPADDTGDALTGDTVRVKLERDKTRERFGGAGARGMPAFVGVVVEVLKRKRTTFTGVVAKRGQQWVVFPDGRSITDPIVIRDAESKNVKEDDKVVVDIVAFPEGNVLAEGVITRVLGDAGRPDVETQAVIAAYDLPGEFPEDCHEYARRATQRYEHEMSEYAARGAESLHLRDDVTGDFIITIDPPDAKDYDDAISITPSDVYQGGFVLGVHIADVSHFIEPGSTLDEEAKDRSNSCYLPRLVIPMLPELLSNGICSLQEGVLRYCKSAYIHYDRDGNVRGERCCSTLIKSAKRLTYLEAQALIDGDVDEARRHAKTPPKYTDQLLQTLADMDRLARTIQRRRLKQGMISLELPQVNLIFDEHGHVVDAEPEDDAFTHTLIEMFMVEANEVLARLFERLSLPLLRRVHPEPTPGDATDLRRVATVAGFKIPSNPTREELQGLVETTRGSSAARAVHMAVLRTMSKAEYSPHLIGHFALASEAYAHFTSPIRRYADLTVHRALAEFLKRTDNGKDRPDEDHEWTALGRSMRDAQGCPDEHTLIEIGKHATQRELNADAAEKELRAFLVLQLLEKHVGESFDGVVTGVNNRGIFVQLDKYLADGFVKAADLPGDVTRENQRPLWRIDDRSGGLVDAKSGRSFNMGDRVKIKVIAVDLAKRQMECVVDDAEGRAAGKAKKVAGLGLGGLGGGLGGGAGGGGRGAGFGNFKTGAEKRSNRSRQRDKQKKQHRRDKD